MTVTTFKSNVQVPTNILAELLLHVVIDFHPADILVS